MGYTPKHVRAIARYCDDACPPPAGACRWVDYFGDDVATLEPVIAVLSRALRLSPRELLDSAEVRYGGW